MRMNQLIKFRRPWSRKCFFDYDLDVFPFPRQMDRGRNGMTFENFFGARILI